MSSVLTVSQVNKYIAFKLKNDPKLKGIAIKGEISGYVRNSKSGHAYFSLKDEGSLLKAVMFSSNAQRLKFKPENGMSVIAFGNVDAYERDGVYQIIVFDLVPSGVGEEAIRLEQLKQELNELGVFSKEKKPICRYPENIAVVTSGDGAALWDIVSTLNRRYPFVKLTVFPTTVQGINAPLSISQSLMYADISGADTIILARGGGSKEDLAAFNSKEVALALYSCTTPVISAVGHEIDVSFADMIADLRAPTPTAAAELASVDTADIRSELNALALNLYSLASSKLNIAHITLDNFDLILESMSPISKIDGLYETLENLEDTIRGSFQSKLALAALKLDSLTDMLQNFDLNNILKRGYALVYSKDKIVTDVSRVNVRDNISIVLRGGKITAEVKNIEEDETNEL